MKKRISHSWIQATKAGREYQIARITGDTKGMKKANKRLQYHLRNVLGFGKKKIKKVI